MPSTEAQKRASKKWRTEHREEYNAIQLTKNIKFYYLNREKILEKKKLYYLKLKQLKEKTQETEPTISLQNI
jgi:hypothetical protein